MSSDISHERELREQWQESHLELHKAEREAAALARTEMNRRLEGMNELRDQIQTERSGYVQRDMYDHEHATLRDSMDARLKVLETGGANLQGRMWMMGAVISAILSLLMIALRFIK